MFSPFLLVDLITRSLFAFFLSPVFPGHSCVEATSSSRAMDIHLFLNTLDLRLQLFHPLSCHLKSSSKSSSSLFGLLYDHLVSLFAHSRALWFWRCAVDKTVAALFLLALLVLLVDGMAQCFQAGEFACVLSERRVRLGGAQGRSNRGDGLTESIRVWKATHWAVKRDGLLSLVGAFMSTSSVALSMRETAICCAATFMMFLRRGVLG